MRLPHHRFDYTPIKTRRPFTLPKGARIAVWTIVNIEEWDIEKPMARQYLTAPQGVTTVPDVPNWAWHDYGMRVGFWRLHEALTMAKRGGLDLDLVLDVLRTGAAGSRMLDVRGPLIVKDEFPAQMKLDLFMKDLHLIQDAAREIGSPLPLTDVAERLYAAVHAAGHGPEDLSVVVKAF